MDDVIALLISLVLGAAAYLYLLLDEEERHPRRQFWVRPWIARRGQPDVPTMDHFYDELLDVRTTWH